MTRMNIGDRKYLQERFEFLALVTDRDTTDSVDALFDIRLVERRYQCAMQGCHDLFQGLDGYQRPKPVPRHIARKARLGNCRKVRYYVKFTYKKIEF